MKTISTLLLIILILFFTFLNCSARESKKRFTSDQGNFSIMFPTEPSFETEPLKTEKAGDVIVNSYFSESSTAIYGATWIDFPISYIQNYTADALLKSAVNGVISKVEGKLLNIKDIGYGSCTGTDIKMKTEPGFMKTRILLCGTRVYTLMAMSPKSSIDTIFKAYVKSFSIN